MQERYVLVMITTPSREIGEQIANHLLEKRLAACVNLVAPIHSRYVWEGKVNAEEETLLLVKSRTDLFDGQLVPAVKSLHPYQVPEIIAFPIRMGSQSYLDWIDEVTSGE